MENLDSKSPIVNNILISNINSNINTIDVSYNTVNNATKYTVNYSTDNITYITDNKKILPNQSYYVYITTINKANKEIARSSKYTTKTLIPTVVKNGDWTDISTWKNQVIPPTSTVSYKLSCNTDFICDYVLNENYYNKYYSDLYYYNTIDGSGELTIKNSEYLYSYNKNLFNNNNFKLTLSNSGRIYFNQTETSIINNSIKGTIFTGLYKNNTNTIKIGSLTDFSGNIVIDNGNMFFDA